MLKSVSDLIQQPYEDAKKELKYKITTVVEAGETHTDKKILMLRHVAEFSSDAEPVTNKDILGVMGIPEKDEQRQGLSNSMGKIQSALTAYIGHDGSGSLTKYYMREDVLSAYEAEHGVCLRTDFLEILDALLESQPITPAPYAFECFPEFSEITSGTLW